MDPFESFTIWKVPGILAGLVCYVVQFGTIILLIFIVYSGIKFLISWGNPTKFGDAKKTFLYVILGGLIILGFYSIILSTLSFFGLGDASFIPWRCGS